MFDSLINFFNASVGRNQDFLELIKAKDIDRVKAKMDCRADKTADAKNDYDPTKHSVNNREDKILKDKNGNRKGEPIRRWKLPVPYQVYINEIALVFLYGQPVKWGCKTEQNEGGEDVSKAFTAFNNLLAHTHFNAKVRQMKRYAGAYTQSALLFRVFRNKDNQPDCQIRVLCEEKGDKIYSRWDQYENLLSVGWEYSVKKGEHTVEHFDIFLPDYIYHCKRTEKGWEVAEEENIIGKIPIILCQQEKEWAGVEPQIEREEYIASRLADTNDYFADPYQILNADIIRNMPDKDTENKTLIVNGEGIDASKAAAYLTWDSAPESKQKEVSWLQNQILSKSFSPNIDFENMKSLSNVTGKALKQMMILAEIKAQRHQEQHDELMDRSGSLMKSIIGNVLNVSLKSQCDKMILTHEFQSPFGEDIADVIDYLTKAKDGGLLSQESGIEQSPVTKDSQLEKDRIAKEEADRQSQERDIFAQQAFVDRGTAEGTEDEGAE